MFQRGCSTTNQVWFQPPSLPRHGTGWLPFSTVLLVQCEVPQDKKAAILGGFKHVAGKYLRIPLDISGYLRIYTSGYLRICENKHLACSKAGFLGCSSAIGFLRILKHQPVTYCVLILPKMLGEALPDHKVSRRLKTRRL